AEPQLPRPIRARAGLPGLAVCGRGERGRRAAHLRRRPAGRMARVKVAVIPGDGIGPEVVSAALRGIGSLELDLTWDVVDWGAERWLADGVGIPEGGLSLLARDYRAILFGALGDPRIPDMAHGRAILLGLRRGLDLYVNYRPIVLPGSTVDLY